MVVELVITISTISIIIMIIFSTIKGVKKDNEYVKSIGNSLSAINSSSTNNDDGDKTLTFVSCSACGGKMMLDGGIYICSDCGYTMKKDECKSEVKGLFKMTIQSVFESEHDTKITGVIEDGTVSINDYIIINDHSYKVLGIESDRRLIETASKEMSVGILINNVHKNEIPVGGIITKLETAQ